MRMSSTSSVRPTTQIVVWFRNDLRLHDNYVLKEAEKQCAAAKGEGHDVQVLPVYTFDKDRYFSLSRFGQLKTGSFRAQFLHESVSDLRKRLQSIGSDLFVSTKTPEVFIPQLMCELAAEATRRVILCQQEVTSEETEAEAALERNAPRGSELRRIWGATLYHIEDLPGALPDIFTKFRLQVEDAQVPIKACVPGPEKGSLPVPSSHPQWAAGCKWMPDLLADLGVSPPAHSEKGVLAFVGGETAALARVKHYMWDADCLKEYYNTRNGMLGADYSTKFSPWLACGSLSPRFVHAERLRYEKERVANRSTYWVTFELLWRDFLKFYFVKHGSKPFHSHGVSRRSNVEWKINDNLFSAWTEGKTGVPFVDANMRELAATGFMSNRGRQNVASYLVFDLGLDWRLGADWFESLLIDSDTCSNWGNWHTAAGLAGGRVNRFNMAKQANDYDANGDYVRHWIPELAEVPKPFIHCPHQMSRALMSSTGCAIGIDYPEPLPTLKFTPDAGRTGGRSGGRGGRGGQKVRSRNTPGHNQKGGYLKGRNS